MPFFSFYSPKHSVCISSFPPPLHLYVFSFAAGISRPSSFPSLPAVCWLIWKTCTDRHLADEPRWEEEARWQSREFLKLIHVDRRRAETMLWLPWPARRAWGGGSRTICWLVQFACYSSLSGLAGPLQRRLLASNKQRQFSSSHSKTSEERLTMKRENGERQHLLAGRRERPPLSESVGLNIGGTDLERTQRLLKNSWAHVVGFFFGGWVTSGSLVNLFEPLFLSSLTHSSSTLPEQQHLRGSHLRPISSPPTRL